MTDKPDGTYRRYWVGYLRPDEREWPNDALPPSIERLPKFVLGCAVLAIALIVAYAAWVFFAT